MFQKLQIEPRYAFASDKMREEEEYQRGESEIK